MDPNATLAELRNLARSIDNFNREEEILRMAELFTALDRWIMRGGFLPDEWARARNARE